MNATRTLMLTVFAVAGLVVAGTGCGNSGAAPTAVPTASPAPVVAATALEGAADTASADAQWGSIKGQLVWGGGPVPEPEKVKIDKDQEHCLGRGPLFSEKWVIDKESKGVKNVFVWLGPATTGTKLPIHASRKDVAAADKNVFVDQPVCAFEPHVVAMREGQVLIVKNSSPIAHNVSWLGSKLKNPGGNVIVPAGKQHVLDNLKADRFPLNISCNIHPWMNGKVAVFDHPYFAVTDAKGNFEIKNAPVGELRAFIWHEDAGWRLGAAGRDGEKVTIKAGGTDLGKLEIKKSD